MKKSKPMLIASLFLSLSACSLERTTIQIGFLGTAEEMENAREAAALWNTTCQKDLIEIHTYRPGYGDVLMSGQEGAISGYASGMTHEDNWIPRDIVFQSDSPHQQYQAAIMAHEFGHAVGLHHTETGLMKPTCCAGVTDQQGVFLSHIITQKECDLALSQQ